MMAVRRPVIALTSGEPAGVGPDLCAMIAGQSLPARIVVLGDETLLTARGVRPGGVFIEHLPLAAPCIPGRLDPANGHYVLELLDRAADGCLAGEFDAMVTAPVHKALVNDAGFPFTGHTEYLAARAGVARVVMMLVGGGLRVALATTHLVSNFPQPFSLL